MNIQCHFRTSRSAPQCCLSAVSSALQQQLFLLNGTFLAQWQPAVLTALAPGPTEGANLVAACSLPVALLRTAGRCQWPCELVLGGQLRHLSLSVTVSPFNRSLFLSFSFYTFHRRTHTPKEALSFSLMYRYIYYSTQTLPVTTSFSLSLLSCGACWRKSKPTTEIQGASCCHCCYFVFLLTFPFATTFIRFRNADYT